MARGTCETCRHYRWAIEKNAPLNALRRLAGSSEPAVYEELKRIAVQEQERSQSETERANTDRQKAGDLVNEFLREVREASPGDFWSTTSLSDEEFIAFKRQLAGRLPVLFASEPLTISHCAVHGAKGAYYHADIKNWARTCEHHQARPNEGLPNCRSCARYCASEIEASQRSETGALMRAIGDNDPAASSVLERAAGQIESGIGPAKAHDLRMAYDQRGRIARAAAVPAVLRGAVSALWRCRGGRQRVRCMPG